MKMPNYNGFSNNKVIELIKKVSLFKIYENTLMVLYFNYSYYRVQTGEVLDGRYNVFGYTGQVKIFILLWFI
jgi:hypothetical protein